MDDPVELLEQRGVVRRQLGIDQQQAIRDAKRA